MHRITSKVKFFQVYMFTTIDLQAYTSKQNLISKKFIPLNYLFA